MPRLLITGATGFIGRACLQLLADKNIEVHATYQKKILSNVQNTTWHACNILNNVEISELLNKVRPNYLIHLAWIVDHQLFWTAEKNLDYISATIHLYKEFSQNGGKKAVFIGTCAEYDRSYSVYNEINTPLNPNTLYGLCKKQTSELLIKFKQLDNTLADFTWVRLFNIFGPHEHSARLIPYIFLSHLEKKSPVLQSPFSIRDYIHVQNLAFILVTLLEKNSPLYLNVGSGQQMSIAELAKIIHNTYFKDFPPPTQNVNQVNNYDCFVPDLSQLDSLNIQTPLSFEASLHDTFIWFKAQKLVNIHE